MRNFVVGLQLVLLLLAGAFSGCSGDDERPGWDGFGGYGGGGGVETGPCNEGDQRECGYKVGEGTDSVSCYRGVQDCVDGTWGPCGSGMIITLPEPEDQSIFLRRPEYDVQGTPHTGGTGSTCAPADLCDPYCYELGETTPTFTAAYSLANSVLCPTTTSLTECGSTVGCAHSPCQTGAGLSSTLCGACVTQVCATSGFSSCCTTGGSNWTTACRDKAFELCLKQQPPMSMCDFGVFSESTITSSNSPVYGAGSKIGSMGDIIIAAANSASIVPSQIVTPNDVIFQNMNGPATNTLSGPWWIGGGMYAAAGNRTLTGADIHVGKGYYEAGGISLTGAIYASAAYSLTTCVPATDPGCVVSAPSPSTSTKFIDGQNSGTATASYTPSGATNVGTYPTIAAGSKYTATWPAPFSDTSSTAAMTMPNGGVVPARTTCTAGTMNYTYNSGTNTLPPGSYGDVTINNGNTVLVLDGEGDYFFRSLKFTSGCNNCKLQLGNAAGDYTGTPRATTGNVGYNVAVCNGTFEMMSSARVYKNDGTTQLPVADAEWLTVYVHPSNGASMGNSAAFTGLLIIPDGTFTAQNNSVVNGAVWAKTVTTDTGFTLNQISKADCESMVTAGTCNTTVPAAATCEEPPITTTGTCPATIVGTPTATVTGVPASNFNSITTSGANTKCRSGADCQTNLRCNNVATVATTGTCTWDKCGTASATGATNIAACATDPCVERITAENAACTPGAWSSTCRDLIPSVCDANCGGTTNGNCVDNASLTAEAGCMGTNGYDLAVGYVCTQNTIPVCNHGATAYSSATHGALTVSWWLLSNRQFAPLTTPTATATGSFTTTSAITINPGACVDIVVTTPTSGSLMTSPTVNDYTVMVDPARARAECNVASGQAGRRLDNWSWYNHNYTCANIPNIAEYDYVADCSAVPDTSPRWRLLRWGAAPGAGQSVRIWAGVDSTAPACTGTSGADACTAVVVNNQTSVTFPSGGGNGATVSAASPCTLSSTSANCAVNLTTALGLSQSMEQATNLSVRVSWPAGVTTPTWDVTYTCEYDQ